MKANVFHAVVLGIFVGLIAAPLYYDMLFRDGTAFSDHPGHITIVQRAIAEPNGAFPPHSLFHWTIYSLSGFKKEYIPLAWSSLFLLTFCTAAKAWLTACALSRSSSCADWLAKICATLQVSRLSFLYLIAASLLLVSPVIPVWDPTHIYIGQLSPTVWHNPTTIVVWPIALGVYFLAVSYLLKPTRGAVAAIAVLAGISVLAKPNFALAFAPTFLLFGVWRFRASRWSAGAAMALLPTGLILSWQYLETYLFGVSNLGNREIVLAPGDVWSRYTPTIIGSLVSSLLFPMTYLAVAIRKRRMNTALAFAWCQLLIAVLVMLLFEERQRWAPRNIVQFRVDWTYHGLHTVSHNVCVSRRA